MNETKTHPGGIDSTDKPNKQKALGLVGIGLLKKKQAGSRKCHRVGSLL